MEVYSYVNEEGGMGLYRESRDYLTDEDSISTEEIISSSQEPDIEFRFDITEDFMSQMSDFDEDIRDAVEDYSAIPRDPRNQTIYWLESYQLLEKDKDSWTRMPAKELPNEIIENYSELKVYAWENILD